MVLGVMSVLGFTGGVLGGASFEKPVCCGTTKVCVSVGAEIVAIICDGIGSVPILLFGVWFPAVDDGIPKSAPRVLPKELVSVEVGTTDMKGVASEFRRSVTDCVSVASPVFVAGSV